MHKVVRVLLAVWARLVRLALPGQWVLPAPMVLWGLQVYKVRMV